MELNFDAQNYTPEEQPDFEPVSYGTYESKIDSAAVIDNKKKTGKILKVAYKLKNNRLVWEQFNIINPSNAAVWHAKKALKELCDAVGIAKLVNTDDLVGEYVQIEISIDGDFNSVDKHMKSNIQKQSPDADIGTFTPVDDDNLPF
jgi:hypothetical protein